MFLKLRDVDLYYEVAGSGDPLLLLHGFPLNSKMWKGQVKALSRFYKVITPDLRGHGKSAAPDSPITMDMMADDMLSLLNGLKIRKCAVAGLSMGGYAAFRMYEKAKERFSCLILSDTRAEPDSAEGREKRLSLINTIKKNGIKPFNDIFIKGLLSRDCLENQQHIVDMVYSIMSEITPAGAINTLYGLMERPDSRSLLPDISCPVLVIAGENDILTPPETAQAMHGAIRNSKMTIIPGAGHLSNIESPPRVNNELIEFLVSI